MAVSIAPFVPPSRDDSLLPPLRIHHFLVWTGVLALSLVFVTLLDRPNAMDRAAPWTFVVVMVNKLLQSAAITCLGFGIVWRSNSLKFPSQPGHWMIVQTGLTGITLLMGFLILVLIRPDVEIAGPSH